MTRGRKLSPEKQALLDSLMVERYTHLPESKPRIEEAAAGVSAAAEEVALEQRVRLRVVSDRGAA